MTHIYYIHVCVCVRDFATACHDLVNPLLIKPADVYTNADKLLLLVVFTMGTRTKRFFQRKSSNGIIQRTMENKCSCYGNIKRHICFSARFGQ